MKKRSPESRLQRLEAVAHAPALKVGEHPIRGSPQWKREVLLRLIEVTDSDPARVQALRLLAQLDGELIEHAAGAGVTETGAERKAREDRAWTLIRARDPEP